MKANEKTARLGTILLSIGIAILILTLVGFLTYSSYTPADFTVTDETIRQEIDTLTASAQSARKLVAPRIEAAQSYYSALASSENGAYAERASFFASLGQELENGRISRESFDKVSAYQHSIDGTEDEVLALNGVINQLRVVYENENRAEALQETLGKGHDSLMNSLGRMLSGMSNAAWLLVAFLGVLLIAGALLVLNKKTK